MSHPKEKLLWLRECCSEFLSCKYFLLCTGKRGSTVLKDLKLVGEKIGSLGLGKWISVLAWLLRPSFRVKSTERAFLLLFGRY